MGRNNHALMTGLFLLLLVILTTVIIFWMGHFDRKRDIYTISTRASVSGLNPQSTVFYRGIEVGKVISVKFDPNDSGIIIVPIEVDTKTPLTKGVYATLRLKGVTGLTQIELSDADSKIIEQLPPNNDDPSNRIPLRPSLTDKLLDSGEQLLAKADHIMTRLDGLLNDENTKNMGDILGNLKTLSEKLNGLNKSIDTALAGVPALSHDAQDTLKHINRLTNELQTLSKELRVLSIKTGSFTDKASQVADSGKNIGDIMAQTTLPKMNELLIELKSTTQQVKNTANLLEKNPQSLLFGSKPSEPAPGEAGYEEQK
jgi:phospholipid/cholesterol/gamma-HCH transport system substrate-binding protein